MLWCVTASIEFKKNECSGSWSRSEVTCVWITLNFSEHGNEFMWAWTHLNLWCKSLDAVETASSLWALKRPFSALMNNALWLQHSTELCKFHVTLPFTLHIAMCFQSFASACQNNAISHWHVILFVSLVITRRNRLWKGNGFSARQCRVLQFKSCRIPSSFRARGSLKRCWY